MQHHTHTADVYLGPIKGRMDISMPPNFELKQH